jgi:capsid assembly protease
MRTRNHKMRHIVARVIGTEWAIDPIKADAICELLSLRASGQEFEPHEIAARIGAAPSTPRQTTPTGSRPSPGSPSRVAVLSIVGTIVPRRVDAEQMSSGGMVSAETISREFAAAVADPNVNAIVLDIASPGGAVAGIPELAAQIYAARTSGKRIIAVANHTMASAAYWLGAQATEVIASPSAQVGSVGVLAIHTETSQADAANGIANTVFRSVEFKAELTSVEPLTDSARAYMQARIASMHQTFLAALAQARGVSASVVAAKFGQGRSLTAVEALAAGMIDRIATLDEVLAELLSPSGTGGGGSPVGSPAFSPGATARPAPLAMESYEMDPRLLTALIRLGVIDTTATQDQASAALATVLTLRGVASTATIDEQLAALKPAPAPVATATLHPLAAPLMLPAQAAAAPVNPQLLSPAPTPAGISASDLTAMVRLAPIAAADQVALIAELIPQAGMISVADAVARINRAAVAQNTPAGPRVNVTENDVDKFRDAARDALLMRVWGPEGASPCQIFNTRTQEMVAWSPPKRTDYGLNSLLDLARESLIRQGVSAQTLRNYAPATIARLAMGADPRQFGLQASDPMYNTTGMFANIMYDAQNVVLRRSYTEAEVTFPMWSRRDPDVSDFKPVHNVIGGEIGDPAAIPEGGEFEHRTFTDGRESYALTVWGEMFSTTWQAIVNDRLKAFTEVPPKQGSAMRRKMNRLMYGILKDRAALSDAIALFHASHNNLTTGAGAPTVANVNTLAKKMIEQTGVSAGVFAGAKPKIILFPWALAATVTELLGSFSNPASTNANVVNAVREMNLTPVTDVELGAAATGGSDTRWFLSADPNAFDTVVYAYLQGLTEPAFESVNDFDRLGTKSRVYIAFAQKALDYRGLQCHDGA